MPDETYSIDPRVKAVIGLFGTMSDAQRVATIVDLRHIFCMHCGRRQPETGRRCQCWNDE